MFKVNVDGASSDQEGSSSVGVVIRDSSGQVMAALCLLLQSHFSAELIEVFALELRVVNGPGRAGPAHFYLAHGHNGLGIMGY